MTTENDKLKVRITCSQRMRYDQTVEMTRKEWEELKATPEREIEDDSSSLLNTWINEKDPYDWDGFEHVEMEVVDGDGEPVKPEDRYEGGGK